MPPLHTYAASLHWCSIPLLIQGRRKQSKFSWANKKSAIGSYGFWIHCFSPPKLYGQMPTQPTQILRPCYTLYLAVHTIFCQGLLSLSLSFILLKCTIEIDRISINVRTASEFWLPLFYDSTFLGPFSVTKRQIRSEANVNDFLNE